MPNVDINGNDIVSGILSGLSGNSDTNKNNNSAKKFADDVIESVSKELKKTIKKSKKQLTNDFQTSLEAALREAKFNSGTTNIKKFLNNYIVAVSKELNEVGANAVRKDATELYKTIMNPEFGVKEVKDYAIAMTQAAQKEFKLSEQQFNKNIKQFKDKTVAKIVKSYEKKVGNNPIVEYFRTAEIALEQLNKAANNKQNQNTLAWGATFEALGGQVDSLDDSVKDFYNNLKNNDTNHVFSNVMAGIKDLQEEVRNGLDVSQMIHDLSVVEVKVKEINQKKPKVEKERLNLADYINTENIQNQKDSLSGKLGVWADFKQRAFDRKKGEEYYYGTEETAIEWLKNFEEYKRYAEAMGELDKISPEYTNFANFLAKKNIKLDESAIKKVENSINNRLWKIKNEQDAKAQSTPEAKINSVISERIEELKESIDGQITKFKKEADTFNKIKGTNFEFRGSKIDKTEFFKSLYELKEYYKDLNQEIPEEYKKVEEAFKEFELSKDSINAVKENIAKTRNQAKGGQESDAEESAEEVLDTIEKVRKAFKDTSIQFMMSDDAKKDLNALNEFKEKFTKIAEAAKEIGGKDGTETFGLVNNQLQEVNKSIDELVGIQRLKDYITDISTSTTLLDNLKKYEENIDRVRKGLSSVDDEIASIQDKLGYTTSVEDMYETSNATAKKAGNVEQLKEQYKFLRAINKQISGELSTKLSHDELLSLKDDLLELNPQLKQVADNTKALNNTQIQDLWDGADLSEGGSYWEKNKKRIVEDLENISTTAKDLIGEISKTIEAGIAEDEEQDYYDTILNYIEGRRNILETMSAFADNVEIPPEEKDIVRKVGYLKDYIELNSDLLNEYEQKYYDTYENIDVNQNRIKKEIEKTKAELIQLITKDPDFGTYGEPGWIQEFTDMVTDEYVSAEVLYGKYLDRIKEKKKQIEAEKSNGGEDSSSKKSDNKSEDKKETHKESKETRKESSESRKESSEEAKQAQQEEQKETKKTIITYDELKKKLEELEAVYNSIERNNCVNVYGGNFVDQYIKTNLIDLSDYNSSDATYDNFDYLKEKMMDVYNLYNNISNAIDKHNGWFNNNQYDTSDLEELEDVFKMLAQAYHELNPSEFNIMQEKLNTEMGIDSKVDKVKSLKQTTSRMSSHFKDMVNEVIQDSKDAANQKELFDNEVLRLQEVNRENVNKYSTLQNELIELLGLGNYRTIDDYIPFINGFEDLEDFTFMTDFGADRHGNTINLLETICKMLGIDIPKAAEQAGEAVDENLGKKGNQSSSTPQDNKNESDISSDYQEKTDEEIYASAMEMAKKKETLLKDLAEKEIALANKVSSEEKEIYRKMAEETYNMSKDDNLPDYKLDEKYKATNELIKSLQEKLNDETDPKIISLLNEQLDEAKIKFLALEEAFSDSIKILRHPSYRPDFDIMEKYARTQRENFAIGDSNFSIASHNKEYIEALTKDIHSEKELTDAINNKKEAIIEAYVENHKLNDETNRLSKIWEDNRYNKSLSSKEKDKIFEEYDAAQDAEMRSSEKINDLEQEYRVLTQLQDGWGKSSKDAHEIIVEYLDSEITLLEQEQQKLWNLIKTEVELREKNNSQEQHNQSEQHQEPPKEEPKKEEPKKETPKKEEPKKEESQSDYSSPTDEDIEQLKKEAEALENVAKNAKEADTNKRLMAEAEDILKAKTDLVIPSLKSEADLLQQISENAKLAAENKELMANKEGELKTATDPVLQSLKDEADTLEQIAGNFNTINNGSNPANNYQPIKDDILDTLRNESDVLNNIAINAQDASDKKNLMAGAESELKTKTEEALVPLREEAQLLTEIGKNAEIAAKAKQYDAMAQQAKQQNNQNAGGSNGGQGNANSNNANNGNTSGGNANGNNNNANGGNANGGGSNGGQGNANGGQVVGKVVNPGLYPNELDLLQDEILKLAKLKGKVANVSVFTDGEKGLISGTLTYVNKELKQTYTEMYGLKKLVDADGNETGEYELILKNTSMSDKAADLEYARKKAREQVTKTQARFRKKLSSVDSYFKTAQSYVDAESAINSFSDMSQAPHIETLLDKLMTDRNDFSQNVKSNNSLDPIKTAKDIVENIDLLVNKVKLDFMELGLSSDEADKKLTNLYATAKDINTEKSKPTVNPLEIGKLVKQYNDENRRLKLERQLLKQRKNLEKKGNVINTGNSGDFDQMQHELDSQLKLLEETKIKQNDVAAKIDLYTKLGKGTEKLQQGAKELEKKYNEINHNVVTLLNNIRANLSHNDITFYNDYRDMIKNNTDMSPEVADYIHDKTTTRQKSDLEKAYEYLISHKEEYQRVANVTKDGTTGSKQQLSRYLELNAEIKRNEEIVQTATDEEKASLTELAHKYDEVNASVQNITKSVEYAEKQSELIKLLKRLEKITHNTVYLESDREAVEDYINDIRAEIDDIVSKIKEGTFDGDYTDKNGNLIKDYFSTRLDQSYDVLNGTRKKANPASVYKLLRNVTKEMNDNSAMSNKLRARYQNLIVDLQEISKTADISKNDFDALSQAARQLSADLEYSGETGKNLWDKMRNSVVNANAQFLAMYFSIHDIIRYIRAGVEVISELDKAFTEMRKVSNETVKSLRNFQKESYSIADSIGTNAVALQNSTADWMRLGESLKQAKESAKDTAILLNVSEFQDVSEATSALIALSSAYKDLDKIDIIDKLNQIGNNFSISTDEAATALQKSASALKTAGNDIDEALALITAANAVVQDADSVGTGIKTISLRLTGTATSKKELEELGEETDDFISTTSKIRDIILEATKPATNGKGVDILDDNGNYKNTFEILRELSAIYDDIIKKDKELGTNNINLILETIAGKIMPGNMGTYSIINTSNCWKILKTTKLQHSNEISTSVNVMKIEKISCIKTRLNPLSFFNGQSAAKSRIEKGSTIIP